MDNLSVIIRNRNEQEYIGFAIQSVIDFIPDASIIVVDNNSTDDSMGIVSMFNDRISIETIKIDNYTPGRALNSAIDNCYKDYILIMSAHSQIIQFNSDKIVKNLNKYEAVFGKQIPIYRGKKITPRYIWSHFGDEEVVNMYSHIEDRPFLHNAFCFYNRQILEDIRFDEDLSGKEDRYWVQELIDYDKDYLYDPSFVCNHFYTVAGSTWMGIG